MFRHHDLVEASDIEAHQRAADQITEAPELINTTLDELRERGVHPWHAPNSTLLRVGLAAIAWSNDVAAENLFKRGAETHRGKTKLPRDIWEFTSVLTETAARVMVQARSIMPSQYMDMEFDEETRANMSAESMLPYWPRTSDSAYEGWQGGDKAIVSLPFLRAMVDATDELEVQAASLLSRLTDPFQTIADIPAEYTGMSIVIEELVKRAAVQQDAARGYVYLSPESKSPSEAVLSHAYGQIHGGFVDVMTALTGVVCPPILGEDFLPER